MFCAALLVLLGFLLPQAAAAMTPDEALAVLGDRSSSFEQKKEAFDVIGDSKENWSQLLIESAQKGELFFDKKKHDVYAKVGDNYFKVKGGEAFSGKSRDLKRVSVNNSIRESLHLILAMRTLSDQSIPEDRRIESAHALIGNVSQEDASSCSSSATSTSRPILISRRC